MAQIDKYLKLALESRASDLHFASGDFVRMRVDGDLVQVGETALSAEQVQTLIFEILEENEQQRFHSAHNLDKSYTLEDIGSFRVNVFMTRKGISVVMRAIPKNIPTLKDLGLPENVQRLTDLGKGLVLVTGPTGSGKSTTLAAMINHINTKYKYHILTVEDPIEFVHTSKQSLINQREIGNHCNTFSDALKYALREDPDVILIGEMRDLETIGLALTAAETGHLVFGTLHTRGAGASVDRIIDSFPANQQPMIRTMLSESLAAVISQALLKRADGKGRIAAYEILIVNHAISNLIREGKTFQMTSIIQTARKEGMMLMDHSIMSYVNQGIVTPEEAEAYMDDPAPLANRKRSGATTSSPSPSAPAAKSFVAAPAPTFKANAPAVRPNTPITPPSLERAPLASAKSSSVTSNRPPLKNPPPPMRPTVVQPPPPVPAAKPAPAVVKPPESEGPQLDDLSADGDVGSISIESSEEVSSPTAADLSDVKEMGSIEFNLDEGSGSGFHIDEKPEPEMMKPVPPPPPRAAVSKPPPPSTPAVPTPPAAIKRTLPPPPPPKKKAA